jgi:hypothetical protein
MTSIYFQSFRKCVDSQGNIHVKNLRNSGLWGNCLDAIEAGPSGKGKGTGRQ